MIPVINDIDRLLQDAEVRILNNANADIILTPSAYAFHLDAAGVPDIGSITVTATLIGLDDYITFSAQGGTLTDVTEKSATLTFASMAGRLAIVTATVISGGEPITRSCIIPTLQDGSVGESSFVWIKYADGPSGEGLSDLPDGKKYVGFAQNRPTATESTNPADYQWVLVKGSDGSSLRMWIKYSDNADGTGMYDDPTETTMYIGIAINKSNPVESTNPSDYIWSRFRGADGVSVPGSRGAGFYRTSGDAWSDATAEAITPGGNVIGDIVTISNGTSSYTKEWNGSNWFVPGAFLSGNLFVEKSIFAAHINANGLSIYTPDGRLIIDARETLAQQTAVNPNLVPSALSWTSDNTPAWLHNDSATGLSFDGWHHVFPKAAQVGSALVMRRIGGLKLTANTTYTLSFNAIADAPGCTLIADLYPDVLPESSFTPSSTGISRHVLKWAIGNFPAQAADCSLRLFAGSLPGQVLVFDVKLERGDIDTAWGDDVITPANADVRMSSAAIKLAHIDRATILNLAALVAYLGNVEIGAGGALRQGQTAYNTGVGVFLGAKNDGNAAFSIGTSNGGKLLCDPANGVFELVNPKMSGTVDIQSFTLSLNNESIEGSSPYGQARTYGSRTVTVNGNYSGTLKYSWSVASAWTANGSRCSVQVTAGGTTATATISGGMIEVANEVVYADVICTVSDGSNFSKQISLFVQWTYGQGAQ